MKDRKIDPKKDLGTVRQRLMIFGLQRLQSFVTVRPHYQLSYPYKGSFNNYVDQILTNFDPLPPSSGQAWTFFIPPLVHVDKRWIKGTPP